MKKIAFLSISIFLAFQIAIAQSIKTKEGDFSLKNLKDGNFEVETPHIKVIISPKEGGRIVSLINKANLEELIHFNTNDKTHSGAFYDTFDIFYPGDKTIPYSVTGTKLTKEQDEIHIELLFSLINLDNKKNILMKKKYIISKEIPLISAEVEFINKDSKAVSFSYATKSFFGYGGNKAYDKTIWVSRENTVEEIPFLPLSLSHGNSITPSSDFAGITTREGKTSVLMLFDREKTSLIDTYHGENFASLEIFSKKIELQKGASEKLKFDIVLLEEVPSFSAGSLTGKFFSSMKYELNKNKLFINGTIWSYNKEVLSDLNIKVSLLDENDNLISVLNEAKIASISFKTPYNINLSAEIKNTSSEYVKLFIQINDSSGTPVFSSLQKVLLKEELNVQYLQTPLNVEIIWHFDLPYFEDQKINISNIHKFLKSYINVLDLIENSKEKQFDVVISGLSLYNLLQNSPQIVERMKNLAKAKKINILATGFGYIPFNILSSKEIENQIKLDKELKTSLFGEKPEGIFFPELSFENISFEPMVKNEITWCYFSDLSVRKGYKDLPGINYNEASRTISTGFGLNALIVDTKAKDILERKTEKAIDELIGYMAKIQNENKKGKNVVVLVIDAEDWNDISLITKLINRLGGLKWVSITTADKIFKAIIPTQTILGEKISGSIYFDRITGETGFDPWFIPENEKTEIRNLILETSDILLRNLEKIELAEKTYPEKDFSYVHNLYNEAKRNFVLALQSYFIKGNNPEAMKQTKELIEKSRKSIAGVYDLLINVIKGKKIKIPAWGDISTPLSEEEKSIAFNKMKTKELKLKDLKVFPGKITSFSVINVEFSIPETKKELDYENISVIFSVNDSEEKYMVKSFLDFDGKLKALIGNAKTGDVIKYYVYCKDKDGNTYISEANTITVE